MEPTTHLTVELPALPNTRALFRRAVRGLARRRTVDPSLPDTELTVRDVPVQRASLDGYARVCGFRVSDTLPATYPHVLTFPLAMSLMCDEGFPFPAAGLIHVANRIALSRQITADERFDLAVHAEDLRPHARGAQFDIVATAIIGGAEVWRGVSTYLSRNREAGTRPAGHGDTPESGPARQPTALWRVGRDTGTAYAAVSGDHNPIHTSRLGAWLFGFRGPIAHGMWSKARCLAALEGRLPDAYTVDVAFKRPIALGSEVAFSATRYGTGPGSDWTLALYDPRSGRPHLRGAVSQ